jgi:hypothetical protein
MSGLFRTKDPTGVWWRDHSLSLVVGLILLVQTIFALLTGRQEWMADQADHSGQAAQAFVSSEFWTWWSYEYVTSLVADTYGVLLIVLLSKWLFERGSAESN